MADTHADTTGGPGRRRGRDETEEERADRMWTELIQEVRVAQMGVQILFGFLLMLPFQARFGDLSRTDKWIYLVVVGLVTASTVVNLTPVLAHRVNFNRRAKDTLVNLTSHLVIASLVLLGAALVGGVLLIVDVALGPTYGWIFAGAALVLTLVLWGGVSVIVRRDARQDPKGPTV